MTSELQTVDYSSRAPIAKISQPHPQLANIFSYFSEIVDRRKRLEKLNFDKFRFKPVNIDDRVTSGRFCYAPNELMTCSPTCFEDNAHLYFAILHQFPESKPQLVTIDHKGSLHASVLLTIGGELHFADSIRHYFGPASIDDSRIHLHENWLPRPVDPQEMRIYGPRGTLTDLAMVEQSKKDQTVDFDVMRMVPSQTLEEIVSNLRQPSGILDFTFKSGQMVSRIFDIPCMKELFMYVDDDYKIIGQIRLNESDAKENTMVEITFNPFAQSYDLSIYAFPYAFWHYVQDKRDITNTGTQRNSSYHILKPLVDYLQRTQLRFDSNSGIEKQTKFHVLPDEFPHAKEMGPQFYAYYLDYAKQVDGDTFGLVRTVADDIADTLTQHLELLDNILPASTSGIAVDARDSSLKTNNAYHQLRSRTRMNKQRRLSGEILRPRIDSYKMFDDYTRFQVMRLAYDFKKYATLIANAIA